MEYFFFVFSFVSFSNFIRNGAKIRDKTTILGHSKYVDIFE